MTRKYVRSGKFKKVKEETEPEVETKPAYTAKDAEYVCKLDMPKEMSEWFDEKIQSSQKKEVEINGMIGYVTKSRNSTVVIFPNNVYASQFATIVNKLT